MPHQPFKENVVIVTGASRGIGEQLAYQLAARHVETLEAVGLLAGNGEGRPSLCRPT